MFQSQKPKVLYWQQSTFETPVFSNYFDQKRFAFYYSAKDRNKKELRLNWMTVLHNKNIFFSRFIFVLLSAVVPLTSQGRLAKALWYPWVNTHFSTLIFSSAVLSPTEGSSGNVLTWRLHMPDKATFLIGLHGVSVGLIGWDYGITERGTKWEWNAAGIGRKRQNSGSRIASLFVDWHRLQERRRVSEGKQSTSPTPTLLTFIFESSHRHRGEDC